MTYKIPFQRWRIFWFSIKHAWQSGKYKDSDPKKSQAHYDLAQLGRLALEAINRGASREFLLAMDVVDETLDQSDKDLADMINGTHKDVPEWLRKDRK